MVFRLVAVLLAALSLSACATAERYDAAGDIHALLVAIRDNDRAAFEQHVDRAALERQIELRIAAEAKKQSGREDWAAAAAFLAPTLAGLAGDALIQPQVFRLVAEQYGYKPATPIPPPTVISSALRTLDTGQVCAARSKDGPCLLIFTRQEGVWRLTGFEGDLAMLRLRR
jgi:hypothetical protein